MMYDGDGVSRGEWCIGFMTMEEHNILSCRQWNRTGIWKELTMMTMEVRQCKDDVLLENNRGQRAEVVCGLMLWCLHNL
jgi:hypothetical protein